MTAGTSPVERIREAYHQGGLSSVLSSLGGYFMWRLKGSPEEPLESLESRVDRLESTAIVLLMRDWYSRSEPRSSSTKVSIVLPTKNRPTELERAISSVTAQSYQNWELIVVNDGTDRVDLQAVGEDPRVVMVESRGAGVGAARNLGLDHASGEFVTFLDDDNVMDPHWIKSIVLTAESDPEVEVMVGAQVVSPDPGHPEAHKVRFPSRFDWVELTRANYIDMGQLAHRAQDEIRFDESLPAFLDWDYVVRLTLEKAPSLVPALSGVYLTGASDRISYKDRHLIVQEMQNRFEELRIREADPDFASIGHHDARAITEVVQRMRRGGDAPVSVLAIGDSTRMQGARKAAARAKGAFTRDTAEPSGDRFDIIVVDGDDEIPTHLLKEGGLILGLGAHETDYAASTDTTVQRRVGDQLWVGALHDMELDDLFRGSSLVKFGVAASARPGSRSPRR